MFYTFDSSPVFLYCTQKCLLFQLELSFQNLYLFFLLFNFFFCVGKFSSNCWSLLDEDNFLCFKFFYLLNIIVVIEKNHGTCILRFCYRWYYLDFCTFQDYQYNFKDFLFFILTMCSAIFYPDIIWRSFPIH